MPRQDEFNRSALEASQFLIEELRTLRENRPIPNFWRGKAARSRTPTELQQEYDGAIYFLQHFPTHWKETSLARIKERVHSLVGLAKKHPQFARDSNQWAISKTIEIIQRVFPKDGTVTDRAINVWLEQHIRKFILATHPTAAPLAGRGRRLLSDASEHAPKKESAAVRKGRQRAKVVSTLLRELNALRPQMEVPEDDYQELFSQNPNYLVFKICKKYPSAANWVKLLPERRSPHSLAYELAGIHCGVKAATIQTAWKRCKPRVSGKR